jgi:hypothetical protein
LFFCRGLGAADQVDEWPQVHRRNLDNVVAFLPQRLRNGPAAVRGDVENNDPQAEILDLGDDFGKVLISAGDERVGDGAAMGKGHNVAAQLAFDALAAAGSGVDQAKLKPGHLGQSVMLGGAATIGVLVPIAAQHGQTSAIPREAGKQLQKPGVVPGNRIPPTRTMNGHRAICECIACIDEQGTAIHATPSFLDARRYQRLAAFVPQ